MPEGSRQDTIAIEQNQPEPYSPSLLLVDGQFGNSSSLISIVRENGMRAEVVSSAEEALTGLQQHYRDALLVDIPTTDMPATQLIALTHNRHPFLPILVLADKERMNEAIGALNAGALHLLVQVA